jgi:RHS repeat-associated protein
MPVVLDQRVCGRPGALCSWIGWLVGGASLAGRRTGWSLARCDLVRSWRRRRSCTAFRWCSTGTTTNYSYDSDGERLQATQGGTTTASATYNGAQEVTSYSNSTANMSPATYDGDDLRTSNTTTPSGGSATTQSYLWDTSGPTPQLAMDSTNAYIYGPGTAPIEQVNLSNGTVTYLLADRLGSVRGTINTSGTLTHSTSYDAWGNPQTTGGLTNTTPFGYAGNYTDPTGLTYNIRRYYDPQSGQFISVDPAVDQSEAPYAYANDDPVDDIDPLGLWGWNPIDDAESAYHSVVHRAGSVGRDLATFGRADATGLKDEWNWGGHVLGQIEYNVVGTWNQLSTTACEIEHNPGTFVASAAGYSLGLIFLAGGFYVGGEILGSDAPGLLAEISHPADAGIGGAGVAVGGVGPFAVGILGSEALANG